MSLDTFRALASAAFADGALNANETSVLIQAAATFGISMGEANGVLLDLAENGGAASVSMPEDPAQRAALLRSLIEVVVADGEIELREEAMLRRMAPGLDVSEQAVSEMLAESLKAVGQTRPAAPPPPPDA